MENFKKLTVRDFVFLKNEAGIQIAFTVTQLFWNYSYTFKTASKFLIKISINMVICKLLSFHCSPLGSFPYLITGWQTKIIKIISCSSYYGDNIHYVFSWEKHTYTKANHLQLVSKSAPVTICSHLIPFHNGFHASYAIYIMTNLLNSMLDKFHFQSRLI